MLRLSFAYAPLLALALCQGCGISHHVKISTEAEALEQTAVGQALLAVAPIPDHGDGGRFALGVSRGLGEAPGRVAGDVPLHSQAYGIAGELAYNFGGFELGFVAGGAGAEALAPTGGGMRHGGLRLRVAPGTDRLRINVVGEAGLRVVGAQQGTSVLCEVVRGRDPGEWLPTEDGDCWISRARAGRYDWSLIPSISGSVYPAFELLGGLWIFGGLTLDQVVDYYRADEQWAVTQLGLSHQESSDSYYRRSLVGLWIAGVDLRLHEHLALLANVPGGGLRPRSGGAAGRAGRQLPVLRPQESKVPGAPSA